MFNSQTVLLMIVLLVGRITWKNCWVWYLYYIIVFVFRGEISSVYAAVVIFVLQHFAVVLQYVIVCLDCIFQYLCCILQYFVLNIAVMHWYCILLHCICIAFGEGLYDIYVFPSNKVASAAAAPPAVAVMTFILFTTHRGPLLPVQLVQQKTKHTVCPCWNSKYTTM